MNILEWFAKLGVENKIAISIALLSMLGSIINFFWNIKQGKYAEKLEENRHSEQKKWKEKENKLLEIQNEIQMQLKDIEKKNFEINKYLNFLPHFIIDEKNSKCVEKSGQCIIELSLRNSGNGTAKDVSVVSKSKKIKKLDIEPDEWIEEDCIFYDLQTQRAAGKDELITFSIVREEEYTSGGKVDKIIGDIKFEIEFKDTYGTSYKQDITFAYDNYNVNDILLIDDFAPSTSDLELKKLKETN